jgi:hypothetical protein
VANDRLKDCSTLSGLYFNIFNVTNYQINCLKVISSEDLKAKLKVH